MECGLATKLVVLSVIHNSKLTNIMMLVCISSYNNACTPLPVHLNLATLLLLGLRTHAEDGVGIRVGLTTPKYLITDSVQLSFPSRNLGGFLVGWGCTQCILALRIVECLLCFYDYMLSLSRCWPIIEEHRLYLGL